MKNRFIGTLLVLLCLAFSATLLVQDNPEPQVIDIEQTIQNPGDQYVASIDLNQESLPEITLLNQPTAEPDILHLTAAELNEDNSYASYVDNWVEVNYNTDKHNLSAIDFESPPRLILYKPPKI